MVQIVSNPLLIGHKIKFRLFRFAYKQFTFLGLIVYLFSNLFSEFVDLFNLNLTLVKLKFI